MTGSAMLKYRFLALFALAFAFPAHAQEGQVLDGGEPPPAQMNLQGMDYVDIHGRRLKYIDEDRKFKEMVDTRRANYNNPRQKVYHSYEDAVKGRYDAVGQPAESASGPEAEAAGPPDPGANLNP